MRIEIIIDEFDSGYTELGHDDRSDRAKLSSATAIIAGQVLPILMKAAVEGGPDVRTLRWPMSIGGKVGYVKVTR